MDSTIIIVSQTAKKDSTILSLFSHFCKILLIFSFYPAKKAQIFMNGSNILQKRKQDGKILL
jgi:hypothetical protein